MCIPIYRRDRKSKTLYLIANLSLAAGLILWAFVRPSLDAPHAWLDAVCGLLMGFCIATNLLLMRNTRSCGPTQAQP
jgi:hypothetical protein